MKAITVEPLKSGTAKLEDIPEPDVCNGSVLVEAIAVGVCGTDVEIAEGKYGWAPPGKTQLVLGHESLGRVLEPGPRSSLKKGDLVVGIVRRPDPSLAPIVPWVSGICARTVSTLNAGSSRSMGSCRSAGESNPSML